MNLSGGGGGFVDGKLFFDQWTHFAVTRDQNLVHKIYRNGEFVGSKQGSTLEFDRVSNSIGELGYGPNGNEGYGSGNLDEVRFWNYIRTPEQIQQNLYREVNANDPGLFVYYQFNDNWNTQIEDKSGNGNYLDLNGGNIQKYTLDTWQSDFSSSVEDRDWYGPSEKIRIVAYATDNGGIDSYEYSIGTTAGSDDVVTWFTSNNNEAEISTDDLEEGQQYFSNVRATDGVGNLSNVLSSNGFMLDFTPPSTGTVSNGPDYTSESSRIELSWNGFSDGGSGIQLYEYGLGTEPGGDNIVPRQNINLQKSVVLENLSLLDGVTYYGTIYAVDFVGNQSSATSKGLTIDQSPPTIGTVVSNNDGSDANEEWSASTKTLNVSWSGFEDASGIDYYEISIGSSEGSDNTSAWRNVGKETAYSFTDLNLQDNNTYFANVRATDLLGNVSLIASSGGFTVDVSAPTISAVSVQPNSAVPLFDDLNIEFTLSEPIHSAEVSAEVEIGLIPIISYSVVDSTVINVSVAAPFTSGDQITFTIQNHTDRAGNVGLTTTYNYDIGYLADYDLDGSIGVSDFNQFVSGWFSKDLQYELGPVSGSAPNLRPDRDGVYNSQDGMAFYYMWHWDNGQAGKLLAKRLPLIGEKLELSYTHDKLLITPPDKAHGSEVIINFPTDQIQILSTSKPANGAVGRSLSKTDTLSGQILSHSLLEKEDIVFNLDFRSRLDITVQISYSFIDENSQTIGSGYTDFVLTPIPTEFALQQNYPNPFNPVTTIHYDLPKDAMVKVMIYDILGREVKSLVRDVKQAGYHTITWDSKDTNGNPVSAGVYFYQIQSKDFVKTKKMILLK